MKISCCSNPSNFNDSVDDGSYDDDMSDGMVSLTTPNYDDESYDSYDERQPEEVSTRWDNRGYSKTGLNQLLEGIFQECSDLDVSASLASSTRVASNQEFSDSMSSILFCNEENPINNSDDDNLSVISDPIQSLLLGEVGGGDDDDDESSEQRNQTFDEAGMPPRNVVTPSSVVMQSFDSMENDASSSQNASYYLPIPPKRLFFPQCDERRNSSLLLPTFWENLHRYCNRLWNKKLEAHICRRRLLMLYILFEMWSCKRAQPESPTLLMPSQRRTLCKIKKESFFCIERVCKTFASVECRSVAGI